MVRCSRDTRASLLNSALAIAILITVVFSGGIIRWRAGNVDGFDGTCTVFTRETARRSVEGRPSPALGRFVQADTLVPQPGNPLAWDRYAYVLNNPLRYTDPSGYYVVEDVDYVAPFIRLVSLNGFNYTERQVFESAANDVGSACAREYNKEFSRIAKRMRDDFVPLTAEEAFLLVHDGPVFIEKQNIACPEGCWGRTITQNKIYIYNNAATQDLVNYPKFLVHELGHAFENALAQNGLPKLRWSLTDDTLNRIGFLPRNEGWQFGGDDTPGEIFADMFVHWTYGKWNTKSLYVSIAAKVNFMLDYMTASILSAFR